MDYTLIALIGLIVVAVVVSMRYHRTTWSSQPGYQYQRVISVGFFGLWLTSAGVIGWDLSHVHNFFQGTKWVDGPIWWQIGVGIALLAFAAFLAWRMPPNATRSPVAR
jgi:hypothetical protein